MMPHLSRDLFGDWRLVRAWGSLDSALGRVSSQPLDDYEAAVARLAAAEPRRVQRGYGRLGPAQDSGKLAVSEARGRRVV